MTTPGPMEGGVITMVELTQRRNVRCYAIKPGGASGSTGAVTPCAGSRLVQVLLSWKDKSLVPAVVQECVVVPLDITMRVWRTNTCLGGTTWIWTGTNSFQNVVGPTSLQYTWSVQQAYPQQTLP